MLSPVVTKLMLPILFCILFFVNIINLYIKQLTNVDYNFYQLKILLHSTIFFTIISTTFK
jgi:hypothetical protein